VKSTSKTSKPWDVGLYTEAALSRSDANDLGQGEQGSEPQDNPHMVRAGKITAGPVGAGTRFCSAVASMRRTAQMLIERMGCDRRRRLDSATTMRPAGISDMLTFELAGRAKGPDRKGPD
jgi:hypothetical protein